MAELLTFWTDEVAFMLRQGGLFVCHSVTQSLCVTAAGNTFSVT